MGILLYRQPGVGSSTGDFEIWLKGAVEVCCLSLWEVCEGNLEGGLPCWDPEGYVEKALETGISFPRVPIWGTWGRAHLTGTLREGWRGLWRWGFSLWRGPVGGGLGGELLHWGLWKICSDSLWIWASLSTEAPIEPRGTWCLVGRLICQGDGWRMAPLLGNPKIC